MQFCTPTPPSVAELYVLLHEVQASGCLRVGSMGISQTLIHIDDDDADVGEDEDEDEDNIFIFSDNMADLGQRM